jgi:site-specific recombinase XerD
MSPSLGPLVQAFFVEHLLTHKRASVQTVAAYRDTFRLLLNFLRETERREPSDLHLDDLDAPVVLAFLDHLEKRRGNSARSRNARLAALRSFFRFTALRHPERLELITRVLAIPVKRTERRLVGYLTRAEIDAVLAAPDRSCRIGRRDHALLLTLYNTGARVSEIASLGRQQVALGASSSVQLLGKGRKERMVPIWPRTARALRAWFREIGGAPNGRAFVSARGTPLTRDGIAYILEQAVERAGARCPSLRTKRVSPHVIRHATAMHLLQAGVDVATIALWLGHESIETTHMYVEADLAMKEVALKKLAPAGAPARRFKPDDSLMAFLTDL